jgi:hypothetical protein
MLIATESSCRRCSIDVVRKRGEGCLAQADSAIVGRNQMICSNPKSFGCKKRLQVFQQQLVLENAPGENNNKCPTLFAERMDGCVETLRDSSPECASDIMRRALVHTIVD